MSRDVKITGVDSYEVIHQISDNLADSTRLVDKVGFVVVDIRTDSGLHGNAVTYHEQGGEAIQSFIKHVIEPGIMERDPMETTALWEENFRLIRGVARKGLAFLALSVIDMALWDIKGKMLNQPVYRLLGGNRKEVPIYASGGWTSYSRERLVTEAGEMVARGYKKIKIKVGVEGGQNPREDLRRVAAVRDAVGPDISIMIDANNIWTSATAVRFANQVGEYDILFFEEPVPADDIPGLARFRSGTDLPLATGEHEYTRFGVRDLVTAGAVDILQSDAAKCGGYTETLRMNAIAQAWNITFAPHAMEHMHMHLLSAAPNGAFLERLLMFEPVVEKTFVNPPIPKNGMMILPDGPGLGLEYKIDEIKRIRK
ncbi:MAG: mandelate racemase/muconate lactonizing enzyme family protein [Planctomycetota bacterium]|jgi:L-alanine-DL-glutamate epimerase-like enolase superfamily enzyme|nr:mandelate racemase/muconate lactonizing enzyme family protein [Planctomycetota bacterium]